MRTRILIIYHYVIWTHKKKTKVVAAINAAAAAADAADANIQTTAPSPAAAAAETRLTVIDLLHGFFLRLEANVFALSRTPESMNCGKALYPWLSFFNHSCQPNARLFVCLFVTGSILTFGI